MNAKRHELEAKLFKIRELEYAKAQAESVEEIIAYIDLLMKPRSRAITLDNGSEIEIPSSEKPAYFEWVVWRAFLAINSIVNPPWESRNFKVDPDFKPISHAASGSSDLIFEFYDFVLVVEVTLTTSSRQEAAEGEPVRRHVANYVQKYEPLGKQVYGLFMAITIDTNTANTFRLGEWYLADDTKIYVQIVPVALKDFRGLLSVKKNNPNELLSHIKEILILCRAEMTRPAPDWKRFISEQFCSVATNIKSVNND
ncbi:AlwI family type II restriction endonuclease [Thiomicrospira sp. R3]|uniref:AlwI family type II restriction endonuclease n=1 Tax=Thiomicrospira sp. R3 TaxID=3035472 RepID=UPI00259BD37A|nr:AlwI family type II restriction endonuclease [Thiomicrospira sp. R3]WFE68097.1 AlwI family type II restriction endonuclease [Thiomicrospira sp. R3]